MYDIIGDLHGHYRLLTAMLKKLGYEKSGEGFRHEGRKVIFTGDYINRGNEIRQTVRLIREMVESGNALAILGNHEFNAIIYFTLDKSGRYFKKYGSHLKLPLLRTIEEYSTAPDELHDTIKWFRQLPFYLDLNEIRVVHGGWDIKHINTVEQYMNGQPKIKKKFIKEYLSNDELNMAVNTLLKGIEMQLPKDLIIKDSKGISHRNFRIKWWEPACGKTFRDASFGNRFILPEYTIPKEVIPPIEPYEEHWPPLFFGHYCLDKQDLVIKNNLCCVDRCVTRSQNLSAYRWDGEKSLNPDKLVFL